MLDVIVDRLGGGSRHRMSTHFRRAAWCEFLVETVPFGGHCWRGVITEGMPYRPLLV